MPLREQVTHEEMTGVEAFLAKIVRSGGSTRAPRINAAEKTVSGIEPTPISYDRSDIRGNRRRRTGTPPDAAHVRAGGCRIHAGNIGTESFQSEKSPPRGVSH